MDQVIIPARDDENDLFQRFVAHYGAPAYMRRARRAQEAYEELMSRCRRRREELLAMVRTRLGLLQALAGDWGRLVPLVEDAAALAGLRTLAAELDPRLRIGVAPSSSARTLGRALRELGESIDRFNRRWREFVNSIDLGAVNALREDYNRYYVLEKECAIRSPTLARHGFRKLDPLTRDEFLAAFPSLAASRLMPRA